MKMEETVFAARFAMLRDQFGASWMLLCSEVASTIFHAISSKSSSSGSRENAVNPSYNRFNNCLGPATERDFSRNSWKVSFLFYS